MEIDEHKLDVAEWAQTPNMSGAINPEILVVHYTATVNGESTVRAMQNPALRASAHLMISRTGHMWQLVPFDRKAWHAGKSQYQGRSGVNNFSLGIELVNPGPVFQDKEGVWRSLYRKPWDGDPDTPELEPPIVVKAKHKSGFVPQWGIWAAYDREQLDALERVAVLLVRHYGLKDIVGHDDVSPGRKFDPGPAFDMENFRRRVMTEAEGRDNDDGDLFEVTSDTLNVRLGPPDSVTRQLAPLAGPALPRGTRVEPIEANGKWWLVRVPGTCTEGWVHSGFLRGA